MVIFLAWDNLLFCYFWPKRSECTRLYMYINSVMLLDACLETRHPFPVLALF